MKILISGAGIAGAAAALFLARKGHEVEVIERSPSFQKRGYAITLKGFGLKLMKELGLGDELAKRSLNLHELRVYEANDRLLQVYPREITDEITSGLELVYRSELHAVLHDAMCHASLPMGFGLHIDAIEEDAQRARVRLSDGRSVDADLVVVAEGVRSTTRRLLWGDDGIRQFDVVYAAGTVALEHGLDPRAIHAFLGEGQNVAFMPVGTHNLLLQCYWRASTDSSAPGSAARPRIVEAFRSFSPRVQGFLDAIPADGDVFCDAISMVDLPSLHRGRTVLLGDAGYCPTFLSGMGASLGLLGAKVLASTLPASSGDVEPGFRQYEATMRPLVAHFQHNARENMVNALPVGHMKNVLRSWVVHLLPPSLFARHFRHQFDVEAKLLGGFV